MTKARPWEYECDDITVVTILQADPCIRLSYVETMEDENKHAKNTHCVWHLLVTKYAREDIDALVRYIYGFGGKCGSDADRFTFMCPECRLKWITDGPCGEACENASLGRLPDFHYFDAVKREVIADKRQAQEELAQEREEGPLYEKRTMA